jgi:sugar diacid utilization regulator/putative methionine-R-sulfoxide reductase with GAF domain
MTESSTVPVAAGGTSPPALAALIATLPEDVDRAGEQLVAAARARVGAPVTVVLVDGAGARTIGGELPLIAVQDAVDDPRVIRRGAVALVLPDLAEIGDEVVAELARAATWLAAAVERDRAQASAAAATEETAVVRDVVGQLLSVHDLDQLLLSVADRTVRLLDADICGVLLKEGDAIRMRCCVGNRVVDTARLQMRRGQGVAGLVFQTGEPARVDDYIADRSISPDFMPLAVLEDTRSALAVPLRLRGELIGVLEVWRRRPSVFTDDDVRRMVTFADVATIAIDNARSHDEQAAAVSELRELRDALEAQVTMLGRSAALQQDLLSTVLDGGGLPAVARTVTVATGLSMAVFGADGAIVAATGGEDVPSWPPPRVPAPRRRGRVQGRLSDDERGEGFLGPIYADGDQAGWVLLLGTPEAVEFTELVAGHAAMACSLALLRERAAVQARTEALEQVLWDLLQGSSAHRSAARVRAQQLNVSLSGDLRVLAAGLENVDELALSRCWDTSQTDRLRRDVLRTVRDGEHGRSLALVSLRGDQLVAVAPRLDSPGAKDLVDRLTDALRRQHAELRLSWGISRPHPDVSGLPSAFNEARTARSAARRMGTRTAFLYEELGIVRLLLGSGDDPDLQAFIDDVTGPLVTYDREHGGALVQTLRAFFDADCSQRLAAERLFVHHKTLRYRLERIKQLTGLDLNRHEDRMRADFALRLLQVGAPDDVRVTHGPEATGGPREPVS